MTEKTKSELKRTAIRLAAYFVSATIIITIAERRHDNREAEIATKFATAKGYTLEEINYDFFKGDLTWAPNDEPKKVETIPRQDHIYGSILEDFQRNEDTLKWTFGGVLLAGFAIAGISALRISNADE